MRAVAFTETGAPEVLRVYPWNQAPEAHRRLERRETQRKLVLLHNV